jgi:hypothetical protein
MPRRAGLGAALLALPLVLAGPAGRAQQPGPGSGLEPLVEACRGAREQGNLAALQDLQRRLLVVRPAPQPLPVVLANAEALLACGAPDSALVVLNRYSPSPGAEQLQWLLLQWRAANGALDHRLAAEALRRLAAASGRSLEALQVPVALDSNGRWQSQAALDLLAAHLEAQGLRDQAATVLLSSRSPGVATAQRLAQAVAWSSSMPLAERQRWLELALDEAAAAGAWGLAAELLDQELALLADQPAAARQRTVERRQRLGRRTDDAYGLAPERVRSPRDPGGHAASPSVLPQP